jgi:pyridoxamine 5'-phosphate oxidase
MRRSYERAGVDVEDLGPDPVAAFGRWFADAAAAGVVEPNAMVLATAGAGGVPSARTVLLKGYDGRGLRFFTNLGSAKAAELAANPRAALVFPWHPVARQVRVAGAVVAVDRGEVEEYFASRPRDSQLGAWASAQSTVVPSRAALDAALADVAARFPAEVPAPPGWGGYRVVPDSWEFWAGRVGRLHDRLRYRRTDPSGGWTVERLAP